METLQLTPKTDTLAEVNQADSLAHAINKFVAYLDIRPVTKNAYRNALNKFLGWVRAEHITNLTHKDLLDYKDYLEAQGLAPTTRHQYEQAIKQFFGWVTATTGAPNLAYGLKATQVRADISRREAFSLEEINHILESINTNTETEKRDYALISLLAECGLRLIECQRANVCDLERHGNIYHLAIQGKGHREKDTTVYITSKRTRHALDSYLQSRQAKSNEPLFASCCHRENRQGRINKNSLCTIVKNRIKGAGYDSKKLTAHSIRHTFITECLKVNGNDIYTAQKLARHSKPETTEIYDNTKTDRQIKVLTKLQAHITGE